MTRWSSLPLANQKAGEIMSALLDGLSVASTAVKQSYRKLPESLIQFLSSQLENRAINIQSE